MQARWAPFDRKNCDTTGSLEIADDFSFWFIIDGWVHCKWTSNSPYLLFYLAELSEAFRWTSVNSQHYFVRTQLDAHDLGLAFSLDDYIAFSDSALWLEKCFSTLFVYKNVNLRWIFLHIILFNLAQRILRLHSKEDDSSHCLHSSDRALKSGVQWVGTWS